MDDAGSLGQIFQKCWLPLSNNQEFTECRQVLNRKAIKLRGMGMGKRKKKKKKSCGAKVYSEMGTQTV